MGISKKGNRQVSFRINEEEYPEISKALEEKQQSSERSDFIRKALLLGIRRPDLLEQVEKIKPPQMELGELLPDKTG